MIRRRETLIAVGSLIAAGAAGGQSLASQMPIELEWDDLIPEEHQGIMFETLQGLGIVQHGQFTSPFDQEAASAVVTDFDGETVRIPGFVVPLDFDGTGITSLLLVPYVGACIHVPPPPANQLIFVTPDQPYEGEGFFEAVYATGTFSTSAVETELADIGYVMTAAALEPYY
ncbi:MAG: DUF3299 domain-containing protein [Pseudomonadota bacterium]